MPELTALRDQIDEVDKALLNLLAKRLELVAESGRGEKPLWNCLFMFRSARHLCWPRVVPEAEALGVPPDLIAGCFASGDA